MRIIVTKIENEYKAVLSNGHRPILTNWYNNMADVYDFGAWCANYYDEFVGIEYIR